MQTQNFRIDSAAADREIESLIRRAHSGLSASAPTAVAKVEDKSKEKRNSWVEEDTATSASVKARGGENDSEEEEKESGDTLVTRAQTREAAGDLLGAKEDWARVGELQPDNLEAGKATNRLAEALNKERTRRACEELKGIRPQLEEFKRAGNGFYKASTRSHCYDVDNHLKAIAQFTEGIELFLAKCDLDALQYIPKEQLQIVGQLYTNRAICNHTLGRHLDVVDDAGFVISRIDPKSAKAYYRRGVALSHLADHERALVDLEQACKLDPANAAVKKELGMVLGVVVEMRRRQLKEQSAKKEEAPVMERKEPQPEVIKPAAVVETETKAEEKPAAEPEPKPKKKKKSGNNGKTIDVKQISKIAEMAAQSIGSGYMQKPTTAYAFETLWRSCKSDQQILYKFMKVSQLRLTPIGKRGARTFGGAVQG